MKVWRKIVSVCLLFALTLSVFGCSEKKAERKETVISISAESEQKREAVFEAVGHHNISQEEEAKLLDATLEDLAKRTEQVMPSVETTHEIVSESAIDKDLYSLCGESYDKIILYIHGGAWTYEIDPMHIAFCDQVADLLHAKVYMPLYPLSPNATAKETYEMLLNVYEALCEEGKPIYIFGDSAGGTLTLGLTLKLRDYDMTMPEKLVVFSPCADISLSNPEIEEVQKVDGYLTAYCCRRLGGQWIGELDPSDPSVSPLFGAYDNFPDTLMFIGTYDVLSVDEKLLYDAMVEGGVNASLVTGEGFWHVFPLSSIPEQAQCLDIIESFCK